MAHSLLGFPEKLAQSLDANYAQSTRVTQFLSKLSLLQQYTLDILTHTRVEEVPILISLLKTCFVCTANGFLKSMCKVLDGIK